jgi:uncharacterized protein
VRHHGQIARVEIYPQEFSKIMDENIREKITKNFKKFGFIYTALDLAGFRSGSMNEPLHMEKKK